MAFTMNLLMVAFFSIAIATPAPAYWTNQKAFQTVLGSAPRTLFASLLAYVTGDFMNDKVFQRMKRKHKDMRGFKTRAILSSLVGELCDSCIFIPIAFIGTMPAKTLVIMGITQVCLKTGYECIILPFTAVATRKVIAYESTSRE